MTITKGTTIYYTGDMANQEGFGVVAERKVTRWGVELFIEMEDGREMWVSEVVFSPEYKGHGGTRFVTEEAYNVWVDEKAQQYAQGDY